MKLHQPDSLIPSRASKAAAQMIKCVAVTDLLPKLKTFNTRKFNKCSLSQKMVKCSFSEKVQSDLGPVRNPLLAFHINWLSEITNRLSCPEDCCVLCE